MGLPGLQGNGYTQVVDRFGFINVKDFGAVGDGVHDDSQAIQAAINAAQIDGGVMWFPPGTYYVNPTGTNGSALEHNSGNPIILSGSGRDITKIVLGNPDMNLLDLSIDGDRVQDLTLDTQTSNGQSALVVVLNNGVFQRLKVLGGSNTFGIYFAGPASGYNIGNVVRDLYLDTNAENLDDFSFSLQQAALIQNVRHNGARLAIYECDQVLVDGYYYSPKPTQGQNGFYVTAPSLGIVIQKFVLLPGNNTTTTPNIGNGSDTSYCDVTLIDCDLQEYGSANCTIYCGAYSRLHAYRLNSAAQIDSNQANAQIFLDDCELIGVQSYGSGGSTTVYANNCRWNPPASYPGDPALYMASSSTLTAYVRGGSYIGSAGMVGSGVNGKVEGVTNYNPVGVITAPSVPASGTAQSNTFVVRVRIFVTGGTVSAIAINGTATGMTNGTFELDPGETITVTYSAVPTWTWFGL